VATQRIGVVGLGNMGGRIARRLLAADHAVAGHDVDPERAPAVGVSPAASPAELADAAEVVLLSLPDSTVVEPVVAELEPHLRAGQVVVDLSTAAPASTMALHARLAQRGVEFVDAGISGGAKGAEQGTLAIMAGGDEATVDALRPLFAAFSAHVYYMGASGSGHTAKLLNNFLNAVSHAATAEVMVAARKAGLDLRTFLDVLNHSSGASYATHERFPRIVEGDYVEGGLTGELIMKDVVLYVDLVRSLGVPSLNAAGPLASFGAAGRLGYGEQVSNRVVDAIGDLAGGVRLHDERSD
jgi:3-hydroxyisobutyrate dehydrogenase-like beta-hydroxyacid dehydrogenase